MKSQIKRGTLEFCMLLIAKENTIYPLLLSRKSEKDFLLFLYPKSDKVPLIT